MKPSKIYNNLDYKIRILTRRCDPLKTFGLHNERREKFQHIFKRALLPFCVWCDRKEPYYWKKRGRKRSVWWSEESQRVHVPRRSVVNRKRSVDDWPHTLSTADLKLPGQTHSTGTSIPFYRQKLNLLLLPKEINERIRQISEKKDVF